MFNFRIINLPDGNQLIDERLKTPYDSITATEMIEYKAWEENLAVMRRIKNEMEKEKRERIKRHRKIIKNPFWRLGYMLGVINW